MSNRRSQNFPTGIVAVATAAAAVALGTFFVVRSRSADASSDPAAASASAITSLEALLAAPSGSAGAAPDSTQTRGQILGKTSLTDAIAVARPLMANTIGRLDLGSAVLALWASRSLTWEALDAIPETSPALFRKDPDAERGKRFCITGTILQIRAEKSLTGRLTDDRTTPLIERPTQGGFGAGGAPPLDETAMPSASDSAGIGFPPPDFLAPNVDLTIPDDGKVYVAIIQAKADPAPEGTRHASLVLKDLEEAEVIAVKSSGALVDTSEVRACGILTGVTLPAADQHSGSSDAPQHRIVGMFDLPENHAGSGEIARHGG